MRSAAIHLAQKLDIPSIVHVRDIYKLSITQQALLSKASVLIAVSPAVEQFLHSQNVDPLAIEVVPNGIAPLDQIKPVQNAPWPTDQPLVACIGQISLRKGQDLFASAARSLWNRGISATYLLIGTRYSGKQESIRFEERIQQTSAPLRQIGRWLNLGYREDARDIFPHLSAVVVPSRQEPLSRVLLESLVAGTPVVATRVGGSPFILEEGRGGQLVDPNADSIASGIENVLLHPAEAQRRAAQGQQIARERFSIATHSDRIMQIYHRLLNRPLKKGTGSAP
jgi:glycosyltransferase involved in cell wall biosynthesis